MPSNLSIVVTLLHRAPVLLACSKLSLLYNITIFGYKLAPLLACANEYPLSFKLFNLLDEVDIEQTRGGSKPLRSNPRSMRGSLIHRRQSRTGTSYSYSISKLALILNLTVLSMNLNA